MSALALASLAFVGVAPAAAADISLYDSMPVPGPASYVSQAFQAQGASEFGDRIQLAEAGHTIEQISVGMTTWGCQDWNTATPCASSSPSVTWTHPITLNLYTVVAGAPGTLITSVVQSQNIPFRPQASPDCTGNRWLSPEGCRNGYSFNLDFALPGGGMVLPDDVFVTIAYNTQTYGANPIGSPGPYDSLNVSFASAAPTAGIDVVPAEMVIKQRSTSFSTITGLTAGVSGLVLKITVAGPPTITPCTATAGPVSTNLDAQGWTFGETRTQGKNVYTTDGLHVSTSGPAGSPDQRKAAGYRAIDIALVDAGTVGIEFAPGFTGVRPGLQLGLDADGDGSLDGMLVGEPWAYGGGTWSMTTNGNWDDAEFWSNADFGVGAGMGYASFGSLNDYLAANPDARLVSYGYSLGSGVEGDAVITSITVGCLSSTFTLAAPELASTGLDVTGGGILVVLLLLTGAGLVAVRRTTRTE